MTFTRDYILQQLGPGQQDPVLVVDDQSTEDIIKQIEKKHYKHGADYDRIAAAFDTGDLYSTCRLLWNFCKKNLAYCEEPIETQLTLSPQSLLKRGKCDCKNYALFCAGVLDALCRRGENIRWCYRFVSYRPMVWAPGHVFVVVKRRGKDDIYLDPVLGTFDYHKPYFAGEDLTTETIEDLPARIGSVGCAQCALAGVEYPYNGANIGAGAPLYYLTSLPDYPQVGTIGAGEIAQATALISATAPALAVIPGAGPFLAVGAQVLGMFGQLFGGSYKTSEGVRWLTHLYQENVLGQNIDFSQVNEALTDESHNWFLATLGVPIYDKFRYHTLSGTDPNTGRRLSPFPTADTRAKQYLQYHDAISAGVNYDDALSAANIAALWPLAASVTGQYGTWKNFTFSPKYAAQLNAQQQQAQTLAPGSSIMQQAGQIPMVVWIIGAGVLLYVLTRKKRSA